MKYLHHTTLLKRVTVLSIALSLVFSQMPDIALASNHLDPLLQSGNATVDRTSVPGETILIYSTVGTSTFAAPYGATNVRVLVVAGGGAGGWDNAGAGGAGGLIASSSVAVTPGNSVTVRVGAGGVAPTSSPAKGGNGGNSIFGSLTAIGGGGGGFHSSTASNRTGNSGGSGGGAGGSGFPASNGGAGTAGQGNNGGGFGSSLLNGRTGGGGGAGAAGGNGTSGAPGAGGVGLSSDITGTATFYAGGGGGAGRDNTPNVVAGGLGGNGGGGQGAGSNGASVDGTANTGGGGGGGSFSTNGILSPGGDGGSGIVIVRFTTQSMAITTESLPDGTVTPVSYSQTLQVVGGTAPYTWATTTGNLPPGLILNPSTGAITGQATATGTYPFTVEVTDDEDHTDTQALSITIIIPVVTTNSLPSGAVSVPYAKTLGAAGGTTPYTWALTAGSLPDGLTLNPTTGAITGTPSAEGTYTFTVEVEDAMAGTDDQELSITITAEPVITTTSLPGATLGASYAQTLTASGGAAPFAWSVASGALPGGLSLNPSTGELTGTPTTEGTYAFTVEVEDDYDLTDTQALSITVNDEPLITTISLPDGTEDEPYSQTLQSSGGTAPLAWSVTAGSLPPGVSLNASTGEIAGTPADGGTYAFTVRAEDTNGAIDTQDLAITVGAAETSSRSSSRGTSIQSRVRNLAEMGDTDAAERLRQEWAHLFPSSVSNAPTSGTCPAYTFPRNLRLGDQGEDVRALQKLLNCLGFTLAATGPGAPGEETSLFRDRTHAAVVRFQEAYAAEILAPLNLTEGTGLFHELSRKKMGELLENGTNQ